ncbi:MAG: Mu-like prophage major head subunit gpT family protein [Alphaproteobacteria bacterium]|nr:Mu-like prophage major head subunit gpT family protein [Alphaproteobacteria bacterium]
MLINAANLSMLTQGFKASFQRGLGQAANQADMLSTTVRSTTGEEKYGWLGKIPNVRKWLGDRVVQNISQHDYSIKNEPWELTIGVDRDAIEDDQYGVYGPLFEEMGRSTAAHKDQLVFDLLKAGFATTCYDGQFFFDTDHPVLDAAGNETSVANTDGGAGTPWFLIDDSRALKPIIFQDRRAFDFVAMDQPTDENVFRKKEFEYGVDGRNNVGFGFWQFAWGSKQTLDKAAYKSAREALMEMKADYGRPLGLVPRKLVVPPALEGAGLEILNAERDAAGATNVYKGTAELVVVPWLA